MTDVWLRNEDDGGEVTWTNGNPVMSDGLAASVFLSLWGGNQEDTGDDSTEDLEWWANKDETDESRKYRSRTQALLDGLPATPANLKRIEEAAVADVAWMITEGIASAAAAVASITAPKSIKLVLTLTIDEQDQDFTFTKSDTVSNQ